MRRLWLAVVLLTPAVFAKAPANPLSSDTKQYWGTVEDYLLRSAEKMPAEDYSFRPAPLAWLVIRVSAGPARSYAGIRSIGALP
jgi:hypothetical protein